MQVVANRRLSRRHPGIGQGAVEIGRGRFRHRSHPAPARLRQPFDHPREGLVPGEIGDGNGARAVALDEQTKVIRQLGLAQEMQKVEVAGQQVTGDPSRMVLTRLGLVTGGFGGDREEQRQRLAARPAQNPAQCRGHCVPWLTGTEWRFMLPNITRKRSGTMLDRAGLVGQLKNARKRFARITSVLEEDDSTFAPDPVLYSVAGHIAHAADTIEWFIEGGFGEGWGMDFEGQIAKARAVESLAEAQAWLQRAFDRAIRTIEEASDADLSAPIADTRIMEGSPRAAVVHEIADHSAHHRGSLAVYARLLGKEPPMLYS